MSLFKSKAVEHWKDASDVLAYCAIATRFIMFQPVQHSGQVAAVTA